MIRIADGSTLSAVPAPTQQSLRAETVVAHPPIEIWRAFTQPEHLYYWFGDAGEIELRVGGAFIVRGTSGIHLNTTIERLVEGRRLVLRPTRRGDDARIEVDFVKLAGAQTKVTVTDPDAESAEAWRDALENLGSVWEKGVDLREARTGVLGIGPREIDPADRPIAGVAPGLGVRLNAVLAGGPAEKAGLKAGDVVISFNGADLRNQAELVGRIQACRPGTEVAVEAVRDGKPVKASVTIGPRSGRGSPPPRPRDLVRKLRGEVEAADANLEKAVEGLSDEAAYRPEAPAKWSVAQVLAHLSLTERMLQCWLDEAARGGRPMIDDAPCTSPNRIAGVLESRPSVHELLARIRRDEAETLALLSLIPEAVVAFKPRWARVAFTALDFHTHSEDHLAQIARIRKAIGA